MSFAELLTAGLNTIAVYGLCIAIAMPVGALLAIVFVRTNVYGRRVGLVAIGSQLAVPLYVFAGGWSAGFGLQGWFNLPVRLDFLSVASMQSPLALLLAVACVHAFAAIPWVCLILAMGLQWRDRSGEETAALEGGWLRAVLQVTLPKLRPWILASCIWCAVPVLTEMAVTNLYQVPTIAEQVYLDASRGNVSPLTSLAAVLLCMVPLCAAAMLWLRALPAWGDVISRADHFHAQSIQLQGWRWPLSILTWTILLMLVGVPILNLIAKAGWNPYVDASGFTRYGWSMTRFATTVQESLTLYIQEFYWSLVLACVSAGLALTSASLLFITTQRQGRQLVHGLMLVLLAVPGPLVGMLVIFLLNRDWPAWLGQLYDSSLIGAILAQQFRLLPLAWLLVNVILAAVPRQAWELAGLDGLLPQSLFRYVIWPQCGLRLIAAFALLIVLGIGELSSSILVLPPGVTTVSMRLFEMLHFGMRHQDSGLCGLLLMLGWCISLLFWKTLKDR